LSPGEFSIMGANLVTNHMDTITYNGPSVGRPSFAPDDKRMVFEYTYFDVNLGIYRTDLWRLDLDTTFIKGLGNDYLFIVDASLPNWRFEGRQTPTDVHEDHQTSIHPDAFALHPNYPNPFNSSTTIVFDTRAYGPATMEIFNVLGQRVFTWRKDELAPGRHSLTWDGTDQSGRPVASGLYLYRVSADGLQESRKMVLLK